MASRGCGEMAFWEVGSVHLLSNGLVLAKHLDYNPQAMTQVMHLRLGFEGFKKKTKEHVVSV